MTFKLSSGDVCMIKYAPEGYDNYNGYVVKLTQASLYGGVECWYSEEYEQFEDPIPESWLCKFGTEKEKK